MNHTLHYLFDPLCGWCYGAAPALSALLANAGQTVNLHPVGLFAGAGARPLDDSFAAYAWSNDQRIEALTGQQFSSDYRERVLAARPAMLDSGPATLALTAVHLTAPTREFDALKAIQQARYVAGRDVTSRTVLAELLQTLELADAAARLAQPDAALLSADRARQAGAQTLMRAVQARGVPTLILESGNSYHVLALDYANPDPQALLRQIDAASTHTQS